jgi:hypothetical protein
MKSIFVLFAVVVSFATVANTTVGPAHGTVPPKKGFNYKKHYKKHNRVIFFNRLFNRNGCYGNNNIN